MRTTPDHSRRSFQRARRIVGAAFSSQGVAITSVVPMMLAMLLLLPAAHAQRAVLIVDGERVEIDFDEVDMLREQINQRLREHPGNVRNQPLRHASQVDIRLPDDEALRAVQVDPTLLAAVADLNSDSFETREQATERLVDVPHENIQFYAILATQELTVEQRSRLLLIVRQRLIQAPRGAVGISMRPHHARDGSTHVEVIDIIEGLPAERVLKIGDRITHLDGRRLESPEQLTVRVQSRRPGDRVNLTVLRPRRNEQGRPLHENGEIVHDELDVELTLGSADMLQRVGGNVRVRDTGVEQLRRQKAQAVMERFSPRHPVIDLEADISSRYELDEADQQASRLIERRAAEHPAILRILEHRRMLENSGMAPPNNLREQWRDTEALLQAQLEFSELPQESRLVLRAVLDRYRELMIE